MKHSFLFLAFSLCFGLLVSAQSFRGLDRSPLDMAYFPDNFAHDRGAEDKAIVRVIYSRPQKKGREIFGNKVPYGKVWRTGANEAPELKVYQDITLSGKEVKAGTYALFTLPGENEWRSSSAATWTTGAPTAIVPITISYGFPPLVRQ